MNNIAKIALASGLSWAAATALATTPPQETPKQKPTPMTESQMDATVGAGIENRPVTPGKKAAKKPVAKKAAALTDTQMEQVVAGAAAKKAAPKKPVAKKPVAPPGLVNKPL